MSLRAVIFLQLWFFLGIPMLGALLTWAFGVLGVFLQNFLFLLWCWELFAFFHYRHCRQEEFLSVLQMAAKAQAPLERVLWAYVLERPHQGLYMHLVSLLTFFVFPGFFWHHWQHRFDARVRRLVDMLEDGVPLERALGRVPGVVSREVGLAIAVGQFTGKLAQSLHHLPDRRLKSQWLDLVPRLAYPFFILCTLVTVISFMMIFIVPKFQKIFSDMNLNLPWLTELLIASSNWFAFSNVLFPLLLLLGLIALNVLLFSSRARWRFPLLGRLYRMYARGQFLQVLGLMLETKKPLPEILDCVLDSELLPKVVAVRAAELAQALDQGEPLAPSLVESGLAPASVQGLIVSAEKAQNLPWALQELGDTLARRSARLSYWLAMSFFPLGIVACACLVALFALGMFLPLVKLMESLHG
jgi:type II secretory pathway component PulF